MRFGIVGVVVLASLAWVAVAAASPKGDVYAGTAGSAQGEVQGGGTLPFTGLDLGLLIGGGVLLLALGLVLRRLTREKPQIS